MENPGVLKFVIIMIKMGYWCAETEIKYSYLFSYPNAAIPFYFISLYICSHAICVFPSAFSVSLNVLHRWQKRMLFILTCHHFKNIITISVFMFIVFLCGRIFIAVQKNAYWSYFLELNLGLFFFVFGLKTHSVMY